MFRTRGVRFLELDSISGESVQFPSFEVDFKFDSIEKSIKSTIFWMPLDCPSIGLESFRVVNDFVEKLDENRDCLELTLTV